VRLLTMHKCDAPVEVCLQDAIRMIEVRDPDFIPK
jgi:hypothetical protein